MGEGIKIATTALANNLITYLTESIVKRYHLDEEPENDGTSQNNNAHASLSLTTSTADMDNLVEPPALQDEVGEYRKYGLEVANNIQNIMRGNSATNNNNLDPTKDLAINALVKYIQDEREVYHIFDKVRNLAVYYIQQEHEHNVIQKDDNDSDSISVSMGQHTNTNTDTSTYVSVVHDLVQKQRDQWLTLPQPVAVAAPWGLVNYITRENSEHHNTSSFKKGERTRDKLALVFSTHVIPSPACKDALRPLLGNVLQDDSRFLQERLRNVMCDGVVPDTAQVLVNSAMQSNIMLLLDDISWREWSKNQAAAAISQTFSRRE